MRRIIPSAALVALAATVSTARLPAPDGPPLSKSYPVLSGAGLALAEKNGRLHVTQIIPGSPAAASGRIEAGARLLSIDTGGVLTPLDGKSVGEAADLIRGPVDSRLTLTLLPPGGTSAIEVELIRAPLELPGVADSGYAAHVGKALPALGLTLLDGSPAPDLGEYRGQVLVLDFWASWCPTCHPSISRLHALLGEHPEWNGKVVGMAVTVDTDLAKAAKLVEKQGWSRPIHRAAKSDALDAIGISALPVVVIVGSDGRIATMAGAQALDLEKEVSALLVP